MLTRSFATCLLAASSALAFSAAPASVQAHGGGGDRSAKSLVKLVDVAIQDVDVVNGQMVATAELTLDVVGRKLIETVDLPIDVSATEAGACDILNLSLGPIRLDVLGLKVRLDDCEGGPVTVDIGAVPGQGNLLGNLLCGLTEGLVAGENLQDLFDALPVEEQETLSALLGFLMSDAIGGSLADCALYEDIGRAQSAAKMRRKNCDLLTLELPNGVHLDLLGLTVDTSGICLDVWAKRGEGNLLGNLLCSLTEILDKPGQRVGQVRKVTRRLRDAIIDLRELSL